MFFTISAVVIILDQITKYYAELLIPSGSVFPIWKGVLELAHVHNTGAAWGMFAGGRWIFIVLTVAVCILLIYFLIKHNTSLGTLAKLSLCLILGGAVGNLIDRALLGYVRDMIYVSLIQFPVFNVADSAVTIGAVLLLIDTFRGGAGSVYHNFDSEKRNETKETISGDSKT